MEYIVSVQTGAEEWTHDEKYAFIDELGSVFADDALVQSSGDVYEYMLNTPEEVLQALSKLEALTAKHTPLEDENNICVCTYDRSEEALEQDPGGVQGEYMTPDEFREYVKNKH